MVPVREQSALCEVLRFLGLVGLSVGGTLIGIGTVRGLFWVWAAGAALVLVCWLVVA